jgi:hypothetical protein
VADQSELWAARDRLRAWDAVSGPDKYMDRIRIYREVIKAGDPLTQLNMAHQRDMRAIVAADRAEHPADDAEPITVEWMDCVRMQERGLRGMTMLLPPATDGHAIAELCIAPADADDEWTVTLIQGVPDDPTVADDHVLLSSLPLKLTRGHVRRMVAALGIELREAP